MSVESNLFNQKNSSYRYIPLKKGKKCRMKRFFRAELKFMRELCPFIAHQATSEHCHRQLSLSLSHIAAPL